MRITCHGTRGSIPVSGPEYLKYGGDTTCLEIRAGDGEIALIDAGTGIRRAGNRLHAEQTARIHLLFTHAHWDHILGFPFFRPLYTPGVRLEIYGCSAAQASVREMLHRTMRAPNFPVDLEAVAAELVYHEDCREPLRISDTEFAFFPLSHPNGGTGYRVTAGRKSLVFLTDNELGRVHPGGRHFEDYVRFAAGADLLLHDAEFTALEYRHRQGWGHSAWDDALRLARDAGVRRLGFWHHNMERTDAALDRIVAECAGRAAAAGVDLACFAAQQGQELLL